MNNFLIGIVIGNFTYFAGERFLKFICKVLKERKENEAEKARETMKMMISEAIREKKEE